MKNVFVIAGKDLRLGFVTPVAYVVIAGFMFLAGFFFFTLLQQFNTMLAQAAMMQNMKPSLNEWVVLPFFQTMQVVLLFLVPILTMRAIAEEKRTGTFELLATSPVSASDIVLGKFVALGVMSFVMLLFSFLFPVVLVVFADPEVEPIIVGCLGLTLFTLALVSLGVAVSSVTRSQTVAGVVGLVLMLLFYVVDAPAQQLEGAPAELLKYLAPTTHSDAMFKGLLQGADIVYFLSVVCFGLFFANRVLDAQRWR